MDKEIKETITKMLNDLKELLEENTNIDDIRKQTVVNFGVLTDVLEKLKEKSIVEAVSDIIRSYDDAIAMCLRAGAPDDDDFRYDFTVRYINMLLALIANLCLVKDFVKDKNNLKFIKEKLNECLLYLDRI